MTENISIKKTRECMGCGVCVLTCPQNAIEIKCREDGAEYPVINRSKCIDCGICLKKCPNQNVKGQIPKVIHAIQLRDDIILKNSASGGAFAGLAQKFIQNGGVVYGAAIIKTESGLSVEHRRVNQIKKLREIQGSKYVQSRIINCLPLVKKDVENHKMVLFSGTPCQVSAVKEYLGADFNNLFTLEIICHGTPGTKIFETYTQYLAKKWNAKIIDFKFRDKSRGWGFCAKILGKKNKKIITKILPSDLCSYYMHYLKWNISRDSCYSCLFAKRERLADITIGDYNGIQMVHPEMLEQNGGVLSETKGISCILLNSNKGKNFFETVKDKFFVLDSDFEHAQKYNAQLIKPCSYGSGRDIFFQNYSKGWPAVEKQFVLGNKIKYVRRVLREWIKYRNLV